MKQPTITYNLEMVCEECKIYVPTKIQATFEIKQVSDLIIGHLVKNLVLQDASIKKHKDHAGFGVSGI